MCTPLLPNVSWDHQSVSRINHTKIKMKDSPKRIDNTYMAERSRFQPSCREYDHMKLQIAGSSYLKRQIYSRFIIKIHAKFSEKFIIMSKNRGNTNSRKYTL